MIAAMFSALFASFSIAGPVGAQSAPSETKPANTAPPQAPQQPQVPRAANPPSDPTAVPPGAKSAGANPANAPMEFRFPLLQEGSVLARAPATLRRDAEKGVWSVMLRDDLETERDREVIVLPSEVLEEMITHIRGKTQVQWFELTAMVLVYRNHNYLLPLMATPLSQEPPRPPKSYLMPPGTVPERASAALSALQSAGLLPPAAAARIEQASANAAKSSPEIAAPVNAASAQAPSAEAPSAQAPSAAAGGSAAAASSPAPASRDPVDPEQFASEVEKALEARIKVVPRSGDAVPVPSPFAPERRDRVLSGGAAPVLLPSHIRVQDRRGVVTRDPLTGTWRFVIQGERTELGERGIEMLPCAALERMEQFVKQAETAPALLVSGRITRFEGRNYLLPSSFRSIASGRWIYP